MSSLDSYLFLSASTLGYDFSPGRIEKSRIRKGIWISAAVSATASLFFTSAIRIWHDIGSILTSALLIPVLAIHLPVSRRPSAGAVHLSIICSGLVALTWILWPGPYPFGIEPMFPALATALLLTAPSALQNKKGSGSEALKEPPLDNDDISG